MNPEQAIQLQKMLSSSTPEICSNCKGEYFIQCFNIRKVSKVITATPQDTVFPIPVFRCSDCGTPYEELDLSDKSSKKTNEPNKLITK